MSPQSSQSSHSSAAAGELRSYLERIKRLEAEKRAILADIEEVKQEARSRGFDVKALETIAAEGAETEEQRRRRCESEDAAGLYRAALQVPL